MVFTGRDLLKRRKEPIEVRKTKRKIQKKKIYIVRLIADFFSFLFFCKKIAQEVCVRVRPGLIFYSCIGGLV